MIIYGVTLLAVCTLLGVAIGQVLGTLIGIPANVGGVGIAMVLLVLVGSALQKRGVLDIKSEQGIEFFSAIYIPVVVAMAAKQNVYGALTGGPMAITAGVTAVVIGFALVPVLDRWGRESRSEEPTETLTAEESRHV
ncbi:malonate transporter subunit MadL [Gallaecimonas pentaromativorans]|uniref:Malonate transporter MadL subunit n=1 Tax=Gallaecimonas pentaromativorans TaxID=584787 RepID=A0A3N1PJI9_9GAMM|nr:malonate transporter subunit MadL [Gallaecimonas pentaromativorans]MED5524798.1 malonate transporter subunit MadL [Pseudomonadota bacterium]ROQ28805.1 malonate transporter MadL subunit [Gallaecimonas pentaromativorans]